MKAIVHCANYNGYPAYFVMRKDDPRYGRGYDHVADGKHSKRLFTAKDGRTWRVFEDWSAKPCAS